MALDLTIRSQSDLHEAWSTLMGPLGFSGHSVWLLLIDSHDRAVPHLTQIEGAHRLPSARERARFVEVIRMLCDEIVPGGRVAFLRSRPGSGGITPDDRRWAQHLYAVARDAGAPVEVVHRACDVDLVPVPMDEVLAETA